MVARLCKGLGDINKNKRANVIQCERNRVRTDGLWSDQVPWILVFFVLFVFLGTFLSDTIRHLMEIAVKRHMNG